MVQTVTNCLIVLYKMFANIIFRVSLNLMKIYTFITSVLLNLQMSIDKFFDAKRVFFKKIGSTIKSVNVEQ